MLGSVLGRGGPRSLRAELPLERGERPLSVAESPGGGHVVATTRAICYQDGGDGYTRLPWDAVAHVAWYRDEGVLELMAEHATAPLALRLTGPGRLPETVRERVMATILVSEHFLLRGSRGVRIAARRPPGGDDIRWMVAYDSGVDPAEPAVRAAVDAAIARLRDQVGPLE